MVLSWTRKSMVTETCSHHKANLSKWVIICCYMFCRDRGPVVITKDKAESIVSVFCTCNPEAWSGGASCSLPSLLLSLSSRWRDVQTWESELLARSEWNMYYFALGLGISQSYLDLQRHGNWQIEHQRVLIFFIPLVFYIADFILAEFIFGGPKTVVCMYDDVDTLQVLIMNDLRILKYFGERSSHSCWNNVLVW